jgi:DNA polymerase-3 subunit alpha
MSAIKNVGISAVEEIITAKNSLGRNFSSVFDFCSNVDTRIVNKRSLEGLVLAGAFDSITNNRAQMFASVETALEFGHKARNSTLVAENSLFGGIEEDFKISEPELPNILPWSYEERLAKEREVTGFYITGHPLNKFEVEYKNFATIHLGETEELEETNDSVKACGVITALKTKIDKSERTMAFLTLDDFSGSCEALMFSKIYEKCGQYLQEEKCVFIVGRPESSGDAIKLHIDDVFPLEEAREKFIQSVKIIFNKEKYNLNRITELKEIIKKYKGNIPLFLHLEDNGSSPRLFFIKSYRINPSNEFMNSITSLLGEDSVSILKK